MESGREVDRRYSLRSRSICVVLHLFPALRRPHVFNPVGTSRKSSEIIGLLCSFSGRSSTSLANGARTSKSGSKLSNTGSHPTRAENTPTAHLPYITPQDRSVLKRAMGAEKTRKGERAIDREKSIKYERASIYESPIRIERATGEEKTKTEERATLTEKPRVGERAMTREKPT